MSAAATAAPPPTRSVLAAVGEAAERAHARVRSLTKLAGWTHGVGVGEDGETFGRLYLILPGGSPGVVPPDVYHDAAGIFGEELGAAAPGIAPAVSFVVEGENFPRAGAGG